jgi:hypothetical protein
MIIDAKQLQLQLQLKTGMLKQRIPISSMQYPLNSTIILNFSKVTTNEVISFQANNQSSEYKI